MSRWGIGRGIVGLVLLGWVLYRGSAHGIPAIAPGETAAHAEAAESVATYRVFLPLVLRAPAPPSPEWLSRLNAYRAMAGLPPVAEEPAWNDGCWKHARYMVKNDVIMHEEDPKNW